MAWVVTCAAGRRCAAASDLAGAKLLEQVLSPIGEAGDVGRTPAGVALQPTARSEMMATVEQTMMKVQRIMTGPMGLKVMVEGDSFRVTFRESSSFLNLRVLEWGKDDEGEPRTVVLVTAPILRDVDPTPELFEWVARKGGSRWFGHVEVHDADEADKVRLIFSHTLLGDFLDQPELETVMWGVLSVADAWDDELQQKFGGKRGTDE